jgi:hypothetical protein
MAMAIDYATHDARSGKKFFAHLDARAGLTGDLCRRWEVNFHLCFASTAADRHASSEPARRALDIGAGSAADLGDC